MPAESVPEMDLAESLQYVLDQNVGERYVTVRSAHLAQAIARLRAASEPDVCSVCVGRGSPYSGGPCICGGRGTLQAEADGLRAELYDLRMASSERPAPRGAELEALAGKLDEQAAFLGKAGLVGSMAAIQGVATALRSATLTNEAGTERPREPGCSCTWFWSRVSGRWHRLYEITCNLHLPGQASANADVVDVVPAATLGDAQPEPLTCRRCGQPAFAPSPGCPGLHRLATSGAAPAGPPTIQFDRELIQKPDGTLEWIEGTPPASAPAHLSGSGEKGAGESKGALRRRGECSCLPLPEPVDDLCPVHGEDRPVAYAKAGDLEALRLATQHGDGVTVPIWMAPEGTRVREIFTVPLYAGSAPQERQWRPIESAPKDGTVILGATMTDGGWDGATMLWEGGPGRVFAGFWAYTGTLVRMVPDELLPTHWMPLPAAPERSQEERKP